MIRYRISLDFDCLCSAVVDETGERRKSITDACESIRSAVSAGNDVLCLARVTTKDTMQRTREILDTHDLVPIKLQGYADSKRAVFQDFRPHVHLDCSHADAMDAVYSHVPLVFFVTHEAPASKHPSFCSIASVGQAVTAFLQLSRTSAHSALDALPTTLAKPASTIVS